MTDHTFKPSPHGAMNSTSSISSILHQTLSQNPPGTQQRYQQRGQCQSASQERSSEVTSLPTFTTQSLLAQGREGQYHQYHQSLSLSKESHVTPLYKEGDIQTTSLGTSSQLPDIKFHNPDSLLNKSIARLASLQTFEPSSNSNFSAPFPLDSKDSKIISGTEKENANFSGFEVLTMNANFITSFKSDYRLPSHVDVSSNNKYASSLLNKSTDNYVHQNIKRNPFRRKRVRSHPYETCNNSYPTLLHMYSSSSSSRSGKASTTSTAGGSDSYRMRTTSLSSGTGLEGRVKRRYLRLSGRCSGVMRSRSMEDLSAAAAAASGAGAALAPAEDTAQTPGWQDLNNATVLRTRDVENVSRAIQQMCVQDTR